MRLVHLEDVAVSYGPIQALDGVSCTIEQGAVGLLGPNGAGKSTLLKTLLGFVPPSRGKVLMFEQPIPEARLAARQRLGYMPEVEVVSPKVSAVSFLVYCGCLFGMSRVDAMERAHEVLNYVGLDDTRYRKMETYSTGMCQRVKFAQALIHDPSLLLLDEPTSGLDPEGRVEMLELIRELALKRKVTTILSTHLMPDVEHVCDRVIVVNKGKVVRDASVSELTRPQQGRFELRVRDGKEAYTAALTQAGCTWREEQSGNLLVTAPGDFEAGAFFDLARAQGTQVRHLRPLRQSLEEAFMEAIGRKP